MKRLLGVALLLLSGSVTADELGDANRLAAEKAYDKAFLIYQKLADAGDPGAQTRLGEMYWFGDGTPADLGKARAWFEKAAAAGNADASASLAGLKRRETHASEIVYWTQTYDGADMVSGKFTCKPPALPVLSETKRLIKGTVAAMEAYSKCFNDFVDNMRTAIPSIKHIPASTLDMMTPAEVAQARAHLDKIYAKIAINAGDEAMAFREKEAIWMQKTGQYVKSYVALEESNRILMEHAHGDIQSFLSGVH